VLRGSSEEKTKEDRIKGRNHDWGKMTRCGEGYHDFGLRRGLRDDARSAGKCERVVVFDIMSGSKDRWKGKVRTRSLKWEESSFYIILDH
jgi:hypothetical protein